MANLKEFEDINFDNYYLYQESLKYIETDGILCRFVCNNNYLFLIGTINGVGNLTNSVFNVLEVIVQQWSTAFQTGNIYANCIVSVKHLTIYLILIIIRLGLPILADGY